MMKTIGIAGGIGSGKSVVSDYLESKGFPVIDADVEAREIVEPGGKALAMLVDRFGDGILDGERLNRKTLSDLVFGDDTMVADMNRIMHGEINESIDRQLTEYRAAGEAVVILVAPLFFEAELDQKVDEVWLIDSDRDERIKRVIDRDSVGEEKVIAIMGKQLPHEESRRRSDSVVKNDGTVIELIEKIEKLVKERI